MATYTIVRYYQAACRKPEILARGLTAEQARAWCTDENTSSATAWRTTPMARTRRYGPWFEGYREETPARCLVRA